MLAIDGAARKRTVMSNDPGMGRFDPPLPVACDYCGAPRYTSGIRLGNRVMWHPFPDPCTCPEAVADRERQQTEQAEAERKQQQEEADRRMRERVANIVGQSGISARFLRRTFATFKVTPENAKAAKTAKDYADHFREMLPGENNPDPGRNGLFFVGVKGTGKTHLAAAIANQLMQQGIPVICMTMIDLLARIRQTFERGGLSEDAVLRAYKGVKLLVIDDMGKEPASVWAASTIYNIVNGRYEAYMPTIVTTNYDDQQLVQRMTPRDGDPTTADATVDRLREMCRGVLMTGESWRSR